MPAVWTVDSGRYHSRAHVHNTTTTPSHGAGARAGAADREGVSAYTAACRHQAAVVTIHNPAAGVCSGCSSAGAADQWRRDTGLLLLPVG